MSIKSTHNITKEFAIAVILQKIEEGELTDLQLENMVEEAIHNGFYNFSIVESEELEEKKYINDLNNLPEYNDAW